MKELKRIRFRDTKCAKRYSFKMIDETLESGDVSEMDTFTLKKKAIKICLIKTLEYMYKNKITESSNCKQFIRNSLKCLSVDDEELVEKIYQLALRDTKQSYMYKLKAFNQTMRIKLDNFQVEFTIDKLEKDEDTGMYRITFYTGSKSSALKDAELIAAILIKLYKMDVCSYQVKSYTKSPKDFFGEGDRSSSAHILEEPDRMSEKVLNMDSKKYYKTNEIFMGYLVKKNESKIDDILKFEERLKLTSIKAFMQKDNDCNYCEYKRYCLSM